MARVGVAVVVDDAHLHETEAIARGLRAQGLAVSRVVAEAGAIYAEAETEGLDRAMDRARTLQGVLDVRPEGGMRLPPMDGRIPQ